MSFDPVGERVSALPPKKDAAITLKRRSSGDHPACIITLRKTFVAELDDIKSGCPVQLLIGSDDDRGKIRLVFKGDGKTAHVFAPKLGGVKIDLGYVKQFPDASKARIEVNARKITVRVVEIDLPDWDKVGEPEPKKKRPPREPEPVVLQTAKLAPRASSGLVPRRAAPAAPPPREPISSMNGIPVMKDGVLLNFDPPQITHEGKIVGLTDRQAHFLKVLVRALGGIMVTADILGRMEMDVSAGMLFDDFRALNGPLEAIGLRLGHQKNFGYVLSKR